MSYLISIKMAIILFPIIALIFTIPFILHQYHKYGSIHKFRVCIIYSFILYMMTVYFLVILPLPKIEEVVYQEGMIRLIPFTFISDFLRESSFVLSNPSTYLRALKEPCFYTVAFNILMTVPFGMYLRYYFKCSLKKTLFSSFLLSLFFELTQLTGLYFIYPYPYRFFDVDDLIMNTLGGAFGYLLMGLFTGFLPSREEIDNTSIAKGKNVSGLRKITLFLLDFILFLLIESFFKTIIYGKYISIIVFCMYYVVIPYFDEGKTLAGRFLNVKLEFPNHKFSRLTIRILFLFFYYFYFPFFLLRILIIDFFLFNIFLFPFVFFIFFLFYPLHFFYILRGKKMYYDSIFKVTYISTIKERKITFYE